MVKLYNILIFLFCCSLAISCSDDEGPKLPSVEERVKEAVSNLTSDLTAPANGWRLEYQPTPDAGVFLMLLDFDANGKVRIKSDVVDNDGEFLDQTITYRIDNALSLELILETYGVFHYLFEQDQASFGAEFEFVFDKKEGENLIFESATDFSVPTILTFEPAESGAESAFSRDIAENLDSYGTLTTQIFGGDPPIQQLILNDRNVSVFWSIDLEKRNIFADVAGVGTTLAEVNANNRTNIGQNTGYALRDGKLVLLEPISFVVSGQQFTIEEIRLTDFEMTAPPLCPSDVELGPRYNGVISGIGNVTLISSLYNSNGFGFQPNNAYTVNVIFVFDGAGNSLAQGGIIEEKFPEASAFAFLYGITPIDPDLPPNSIGLIMEDGSIYVREFEPTTTEGNKVSVTFTENFYFDDGSVGLEDDLREVTDLIFEGTDLHAFTLPSNANTVFRLFNPCNKYEIFLVQ